ncbi:hypothetical protein ZIOFF_060097 [Zingiber officinale]|uniref:CCHC-type domain-containing protein n=1 Tax=Zingiber officinale TaxID=94328 RepID=A0A8J5KBW4_ZINOF|nr:hypothetical protein ZIOFF_060097 [Zingiber officinale]
MAPRRAVNGDREEEGREEVQPPSDAATRLLEGMAQLFEQYASNAHRGGQQDIYVQFRRMDPKDFSGTTDPFVAEGWIRSLEVIFRYMNMVDADRGDLSVAEFVKKFDRGCHFVPLIANDAAKKLRHFLDGLRPTIRRDVLLTNPAAYNDAVNGAYRAEQSLKDIEWEMQRKRPQPQQQNKKPYTGPQKGQQKPLGNPKQQLRAAAPKTEEKPLCKECNRQHHGKCMWGTYKCFNCGEEGHKALDCPKKKQPMIGRAFVMHAKEAEPDTTLITGRIFIAGIGTYALLDSGATHSFISETFLKRLGILPEDMDVGFRVIVPSGEQMLSTKMVKDIELRLQRKVVRVDFIVLPMPEFDIILGIDWLSRNGASIDFRQRTVSIRLSSGEMFTFEAVQNKQLPPIISCIGAKKLLRRGNNSLEVESSNT